MLRVYDDTKKFWDEVSPHLLKEESKNCLMLGLAKKFTQDPSDRAHQAAIFDGDRLRGAIVLSRNFTDTNLVASPVADETTARALFKSLPPVQITSGIAEKETCTLFRGLVEAQGLKTFTRMEQGIYRCNKVRMPKSNPKVKFRFARELDIDLLGRWVDMFRKEATPAEPKIDGRQIIKMRIEAKNVYLAEINHRPVAMAAYSRDIGTSCAVNLVYTPKSARKKGYGSLVTAKLTKLLLERGKRETNLFTDWSNATSNKIYQGVGYELVCHSLQFGIQPKV